MQLVQSKLQFQDYKVNRLTFSSIPDFEAKDDEVFNLNPEFTRRIEALGDDKYSLTLSVSLGTNGERMPFVLEASVTGLFVVKDVEDPFKMMKLNATSILFPYVRSLLSMLSNLASIPPVVLPPINFAEMVNRAEEKAAEETKN